MSRSRTTVLHIWDLRVIFPETFAQFVLCRADILSLGAKFSTEHKLCIHAILASLGTVILIIVPANCRPKAQGCNFNTVCCTGVQKSYLQLTNPLFVWRWYRYGSKEIITFKFKLISARPKPRGLGSMQTVSSAERERNAPCAFEEQNRESCTHTRAVILFVQCSLGGYRYRNSQSPKWRCRRSLWLVQCHFFM